ncbi:MAG: gamma-glutamylcyclotransferase [SAR324 cluster bacterium]|nr:gamma-glutamylcyclotransferase [SAR324 cluster bacterium]
MASYNAEKIRSSLKLRSEEERELIANKILESKPDPNAPTWIFGYGSLMWNPEINYTRSLVGTLQGFQRKFCFWSVLGRGTPENPGLMMGLWQGGECTGALFCLPRSTEREELDKLVYRECRWGVYIPRWLPVKTEESDVTALVFTVDRTHPVMVGDLPENEVVHYLATAEGSRGSSRDYLFNTLEEMKKLGIFDEPIEKLGEKVQAYPIEQRLR